LIPFLLSLGLNQLNLKWPGIDFSNQVSLRHHLSLVDVDPQEFTVYTSSQRHRHESRYGAQSREINRLIPFLCYCGNYGYGGSSGWLCGLRILLKGMIEDYDNHNKNREHN
jgi:hypothetical protein